MACRWYSVCPLRRWESEGRLSRSWAQDFFETTDEWRHCRRYQLEDQGMSHPDNMLPSGQIDPTLPGQRPSEVVTVEYRLKKNLCFGRTEMRLLLRLAIPVFFGRMGLLLVLHVRQKTRGHRNKEDIPRDGHRRRKAVQSSVIADDIPWTSDRADQCPFCRADIGPKVLERCGTVVAIADKYPGDKGPCVNPPRASHARLLLDDARGEERR